MFYALLGLIISPVLLYLIVLIPGVQNYTGQSIANRLSKDLGTEISVESVYFTPIKKIVLKGLLIKDSQKDTLLYIQKINAQIDSLDFSSKQIYFASLTASKLKAHLISNDINANYSFIIDSLFKNKTSKSKWQYNVKDIRLKSSEISYKKQASHNSNSIFNPNDIHLKNLSLNIDKISQKENRTFFHIKNLSLKEKSGLNIKKMKGYVRISDNRIELTDFRLNTLHSFISIGTFKVSPDSLQNFNSDFNRIPIELKINSLALDHKDLKLFIPNFPKLQDRINLRGYFSGTLEDLKGRDINIIAGTSTNLLTNFDISGLPNFKESYVHLNVKHLKTSIVDIAKILSLKQGNDSYEFPESFQEIGQIEYSGNFTGFLDNLVAYGQFKTKLGDIKTDIGIKLTEDDKLVYSGYINTQSFNIGKLIHSDENLTRVTMDVSVQGYKKGKDNFNSYIQGSVDSIDINGYKYEKIVLNGLLSNKKFNGVLNLNDPNAQLMFNGKVDFQNTVPDFDFTASIDNLNLDKLNIAPNLINSKLSVKLNSRLYGNSINTLSGKTVIHDGKIQINENTYPVDSLLIIAQQDSSYKTIDISSDILEGRLSGNYNLNTIPKDIKKTLAQYLPSVFDHFDDFESSNQFDFSLQTKKIEGLTQAIKSNIVVSDSSYINGTFDGNYNYLKLNASLGKMTYNVISGNNIAINLETKDNQISTKIKSDLIYYKQLLPLHHFSIDQECFNDSILLSVNWHDDEKEANKGALFTHTTINKTQLGETFAKIHILPSSVVIADSTWTVQDAEINILPNGLRFNTFRVHHLNQEININGSIYKDLNGKLETHIQNINLEELSSLLNIKRLKLEGLLNGSVYLKNSYLNPIITSNIALRNFRINDEDIGLLRLNSSWDQDEKQVVINSKITRNKIVPLIGSGYYKPSDKNFYFDFELDSLPLGFLNLYTNKVIQNLKGNGSGSLSFSKTSYGIALQGGVKVNDAIFDVDLLQCSYHLKDSVMFTPEKIFFDNMTLTDANGNKGIFEGAIHHRNFYNMDFGLYIHANNMLLMDTKPKDNPLYYGTVYATGDLAVTGSTYDLNLNLNGVTERNTKFYIPMSDKEESLDNNFIRFLNRTEQDINDNSQTSEYKADISNFSLNMGIEVTPDAEVQVIFDPAVGDILKSWGRGNINIQMNKEGDVSFFGEYVAEKGDYLFSLENIVNKRFDINRGGTVIWEGDPYDAIIDLTATYKLKTSIQPLILPSSGQTTENSELNRRVPIHCDLILSKRLSQPNIKFNISAPTLEQSNQNLIDEAISTDEELNRQVLSLLVMNKFYTPNFNASNSSNSGVNSAALANTSEMLSGQLSNWLSQISNDVDVGINYRPEDELSSEQIEVALSTQIFNDRVTLNGNVEYGKYSPTSQSSSNIVGDFDLDVKLNKSGSLRAKAYTHSNDDFSFDSSPTTQGIGISYQEEFDTVGELLRKYWNWITGKAKKEEEVTVKEE